MKRLLLVILFLGTSSFLFGYKLIYAEQLYRLYHQHFYQYSDDTMENIVWLEEALKADFCNPLYALAKIENPEEWRHYRYLFKMHVNLLLTHLYLHFGSRYDKREAYFYNAPWKKQNLESLDTAEELYLTALYYWKEAVSWAKELTGSPHHLEEVQIWEDEQFRIQTGELDYRDIIEEQLERLSGVREKFESMDENTY